MFLAIVLFLIALYFSFKWVLNTRDTMREMGWFDVLKDPYARWAWRILLAWLALVVMFA